MAVDSTVTAVGTEELARDLLVPIDTAVAGPLEVSTMIPVAVKLVETKMDVLVPIEGVLDLVVVVACAAAESAFGHS